MNKATILIADSNQDVLRDFLATQKESVQSESCPIAGVNSSDVTVVHVNGVRVYFTSEFHVAQHLMQGTQNLVAVCVGDKTFGALDFHGSHLALEGIAHGNKPSIICLGDKLATNVVERAVNCHGVDKKGDFGNRVFQGGTTDFAAGILGTFVQEHGERNVRAAPSRFAQTYHR